jgi:8-oxo-dGTP pyrophosphatase MutT (NUDIX family)
VSANGDGVRRRRAVRVLLLDARDRLILLHCVDTKNPARAPYWVTVGGGVEPGESDEDAARREVLEEVGIEGFAFGPLIAHYRSVFTFEGIDYDQENDYYLARTDTTEIDGSGRDEIEVRSTLGHRWWTPQELIDSGDEFTCPGLGQLLSRVLREGPPATPVTLAP